MAHPAAEVRPMASPSRLFLPEAAAPVPDAGHQDSANPSVSEQREASENSPHSRLRKDYGTSKGESVSFLPTTSSCAF